MAELGGALGVRWLVSGTLARLGRDTVLSLKLINLSTASVLARSTRRAAGEESLLDQGEGAAAALIAMTPFMFRDDSGDDDAPTLSRGSGRVTFQPNQAPTSSPCSSRSSST